MSKTINTLEFRELAFKEIYQRYSEPKTQRRAFSFLEAAIQCFDKKGFENVTITMIAREAGVTRQLLSHYFKDLAEIREFTIKYVRVIGQQLMLQQLEKKSQPDQILQTYLYSHWLWVSHFKNHVRVWLNFLSYCSKRESDRTINTRAMSAGHDRIKQILHQGRIEGYFRHQNDAMTATVIQTLITGWLTNIITKDIENPQELSETIIQHVLNMVGSKSLQSYL